MRTNKVVLVIDDIDSVLQFIRVALADQAVDLVTAVDGASGLELAKQLVPDLVLLDLALPEIDGWEVLTELRTDPETRDVPVVIVTAHGESGAAARARELGANGFLSKPFRPAELRRIVDANLRGPLSQAG